MGISIAIEFNRYLFSTLVDVMHEYIRKYVGYEQVDEFICSYNPNGNCEGLLMYHIIND